MMQTRRIPFLAAAVTLLAPAVVATAEAPLGTGFSYQGQVKQAGAPLDDTADLRFSLWDALDGGNQVGVTDGLPEVEVVNGLFTVEPDFGAAAFDGNARWLELAVRSPAWDGSGGEPPFTTLSPRQPVTSTPYALQTRGLHVDAAGNVGIGTTNPDTKLHVQGGTDTAPGGGGYLVLGSTTELNISFDNNEIMARNNGAPAPLYLNLDGGNVGIGAAPPTHPLHIKRDWAFIALDTNEVDQDAGIRLAENGAVKWHLYNDGDSGDMLRIGTSSGAGIRMTQSGNVGIGTSSPQAGLHLKGETFPSSFMYLQSDSGGGVGFRLYEGEDLKWHIFHKATDNDFRIASSDGSVAFCAEQSGGNVGIGTTDPETKLHVEGGTDTAPSGGGYLVLGPTTGPNISFDDNEILARNNGAPSSLHLNIDGGNVGIGTNFPTAKLHVAGTPGVDGIKFPDGTLQTTAAAGPALVPIGAVIDWWRPNNTFPVPSGFQICNGTVVNNPLSPFNGQTLPDLRSRFVLGASSLAVIGGTGGSLAHTHSISGSTASKVVTMGSASQWEVASLAFGPTWNFARNTHTHTTNSHNHGGGSLATSSAGHLPPYVGLLKIMRIR